MLLCGLALMTAAQFAFAFVHSFPAAVLARAVVGAGDAMIFVSVLRLVTVWFLVRQAPLVTQLTGQVGQFGAIIAAAPLSLALHRLGWTDSFAIFSSVGIVLLVAVALMVKDSPYRRGGPVRIKMAALTRSLRLVWGNPGTRLGMWSHFTSQFSGTVFTLLWGYPFLVDGEGLSPGLASTLLTLVTVFSLLSGLVLAHLVGRFPFYRSVIVLVVVAAIAATWTLVLAWPGPAPLPVLVLLVCVTATGGPTSMVAFDLSRSFTPVQAAGRANGVVNIGGFVASLCTIGLVGVVLDLLSHGASPSSYSLTDFRVAMAVQYLFWGFGALQIWRYRRKAIAHLRRLHPGAVEMLKRGETFVHPGIGDHEGV
jgi:MFS family permease